MADEGPPKTLADLGLGDALTLGVSPPPRITNLAVDSRLAGPGTLFFALKGVQVHGADFAPAAIKAGAAAVVVSLEGAERLRARLDAPFPVPVIVVTSPRRALSAAAAAFFAAQPPEVAAVTGTNGKTSVARFTQQIWASLGRPSAAVGTTGIVGRRLNGGDLDEPLSHTTPEPITLHRLLARLAGLGATCAAIEASSHALAQHRLNSVRLSAAAITNLSRDHLDYHSGPADYAAAKLRLFADILPPDGAAVLNMDAEISLAAREIAQARGQRVIEIGRAAGPEGLKILDQRPDAGGQALTVAADGGRYDVRLPLVGRFQGENALLAAGLVVAGGVPAEAALEALASLEGAPGRMDLVARRANGAGVFVDYAHTPDAVATAIAAIRPHAEGRVVAIIGAGGDRDPGKRGPMGAAAATADAVIVTDDNPRSEDPATIRAAVWEGLGAAADTAQEIGDRAEAILNGVDMLEPDDVLLILGKGHERGQVVAGDILPFDDSEQARAAVQALDGLPG